MNSDLTIGIYGGGPLYSGGSGVIDDLRASGFTTVIAWSVHVNANGDLVFNDTPIVQGGKYVGTAAFPSQLAALKQAPTSVKRVLFSTGGAVPWVQDFTHVSHLIKSQGTGPKSILYENFSVLRQTFPGIDAIDFDDEDLYDQKTVVQFAEMLAGLGFGITFCPFTDIPFWTGCLKALNTPADQVVQQFNLQCYSGGFGEDPSDWITAVKNAMGSSFDAAGFVFPGLGATAQDPNTKKCAPAPGDGYYCPGEIVKQFGDWKATGISGGWIWLLDAVLACQSSGACKGPMGTAAYAKAIRTGLG